MLICHSDLWLKVDNMKQKLLRVITLLCAIFLISIVCIGDNVRADDPPADEYGRAHASSQAPLALNNGDMEIHSYPSTIRVQCTIGEVRETHSAYTVIFWWADHSDSSKNDSWGRSVEQNEIIAPVDWGNCTITYTADDAPETGTDSHLMSIKIYIDNEYVATDPNWANVILYPADES